jgi:hypothetical protein
MPEALWPASEEELLDSFLSAGWNFNETPAELGSDNWDEDLSDNGSEHDIGINKHWPFAPARSRDGSPSKGECWT